MAWRTFSIHVDGFDPFVLSAASRSKARAMAFRRFSEPYPDVTFGDFCRNCRVLSCAVPADDGYDYVRRNYGLPLIVGQRVRLKDEGQLSGREGMVLYPGPSTAHVYVRLDGELHASLVHPGSVDLLETA